MTYILYGDRGSGSATVELALAAIGAAWENRDVALGDDSQRSAAYEAINPQRKLPALLTPVGETLTESAAILLTLADRHAEAGLLPAEPRARATALRWLLFMASELYPIIEIVDYPQRFQPESDDTPTERRRQVSAHGRRIWRRRWLLVEQAVGGTPWFLSAGFSLVDIYAAVLSRWGQVDDWRRVHLPRIEGIAAAIRRRDDLADVWTRHFGD